MLGDQVAAQAQSPDAGRRPVGRPRKWASEAERKRAYRQRLATDLDEPLTMRRELRTERRRSAGLQQENKRLRVELAAMRTRTEEAEHQAADLRARAEWLATKVEAEGRHTFDLLAKIHELQAEVHRLKFGDALKVPSSRPARPDPGRRAAMSRPIPSPLGLRRCESAGCRHPAIVRLQGPRGVERDACEEHQRTGRHARRWRVIRRY